MRWPPVRRVCGGVRGARSGRIKGAALRGWPQREASGRIDYFTGTVQDITEDKRIRVVFFKENLSTGWDCPRAETMMSFRKAEDATYIAQLLGRMVRTPLQCHIDVDESLNDVRLYLPHFNMKTVGDVVNTVPRVSCDEPHDSEVFFVGDLPDGDYPGDDESSAAADALCYQPFIDFVGLPYEASAYDYTWYSPTQQSWESGSRAVRCVAITDSGEKLPGGTLEGVEKG